MESGYIPGVYLYCDCWCERCRFAERCEVNSQLAERDEAYYERGEDPDSFEALQADLLGYLAFLKEAQQAPPERSGAAFAAEAARAYTEKASDDPRHPIVRVAVHARYALYALLKELQVRLHEERERLRSQPGGPLEEDEIRLMRLEDAFEVIAWYHLLLVPRAMRALDAQARCAALGARDPARATLRDSARGNARLVCQLLDGMLHSLDEIAAQLADFRPALRGLTETVSGLREWMVSAVPGCLSFRRPGWDDP